MTDANATTTVSVRAEAQRISEPDEASLLCTVRAVVESKSAAVAAVRAALTGVLAELEALGGEVLTVETSRSRLTWSAQSLRTNDEHVHDKATGNYGPTGRHQASIELRVAVRDFVLLEAVSTALSRHDSLDFHSVSWSVDDDNPRWALVRADAIDAALVKGRDYAAALGGQVIGVDHIADAGLLGGDGSHRAAPMAHSMAFSNDGGAETSIDPVPQILNATIEARFTVLIGEIPSR